MAWNFTMMSENDLYNADQVCNENFRHLAENVLESVSVTKNEYDSIAVKAADKLYVVTDGSSIKLYLGTKQITASGGLIVVRGTQAEYDDIEQPDENTVYVIVG